jgi:hypothetical protein
MHMMVSNFQGKHSRLLQEDFTDRRKGGEGPEQRKKQDMNFSGSHSVIVFLGTFSKFQFLKSNFTLCSSYIHYCYPDSFGIDRSSANRWGLHYDTMQTREHCSLSRQPFLQRERLHCLLLYCEEHSRRLSLSFPAGRQGRDCSRSWFLFWLR